jgi:hypothetical protein
MRNQLSKSTYTPEGGTYEKENGVLNPELDKPLTDDLLSDQAPHEKPGLIQRGVLGEDDPTDDDLVDELRLPEESSF